MKIKMKHTGTPNLYLINETFYYRKQISGLISQHLGLREIRRSLKTGNIQAAQLRCSQLNTKVNRLLKDTTVMLLKNISPSIVKMARAYFETELEYYMENIELGPFFDGKNFDPISEADGLPEEIEQYREMAVTQQFSPYIHDEIGEMFKTENKPTPKKKGDDYIHLGVMLCRAKAEVFRIYLHSLKGEYDQTMRKDPFFLEEKEIKYFSNPEVESMKLARMIEIHRDQKDEEIKLGTKEDYNRIYNWMLEWFGKDALLISITKPKIVSFKNMLTKMPKNYSKSKAYKNLKLKEVIHKSNQSKQVVLLSNKTQSKYFSLVKAFFQWTVDEGNLDFSPAANVKPSKNKNETLNKSRLPYSREDIKQLLFSPLFTGYNAPHQRHIKGNMKIQMADYWAWLIGFLAGLRVKEIVLLHRRDIYEDQGILCFSVNNDHGKGTKTTASIRLVPIHQTLIELGFLDWVKKQTKGKQNNPIFPSFISKCEKDFSKTATRRLNPYLRKIGITDSRKVFHSTRHNFADELRTNNVQEYNIKKLLGHSEGGVTGGYGKGASITMLKEAVDNCYRDIDFSHLKNLKL